MTKNQVVGKVNRDRITLKQRPIANVPVEARARGPAPSVLSERYRCKWISGEDWREKARRGEDVFCGKRVAEVDGVTQSYCPEHLRKVYVSKARVA